MNVRTLDAATFAASKVRRRLAPLRELVYGPRGVGKTTWAADAPRPAFVGEIGGENLDVEINGWATPSWEALVRVLTALEVMPHDFETAVVDNVEYVQRVAVWPETVRRWRPDARDGQFTIADVPFQQGYRRALFVWEELLQRLSRLQVERRARDGRLLRPMHVILLGHSVEETFKNPHGDDYVRHQLLVDKHAVAAIEGWVESVLFAGYDVALDKGDPRSRTATGRARWLYLERTVAFDAKCRHGAPASGRLPLEFGAFWEFVHASNADRAKGARATLERQAHELRDQGIRERALLALADAGEDLAALRRLSSRVMAWLAEQDERAPLEDEAPEEPQETDAVAGARSAAGTVPAPRVHENAQPSAAPAAPQNTAAGPERREGASPERAGNGFDHPLGTSDQTGNRPAAEPSTSAAGAGAKSPTFSPAPSPAAGGSDDVPDLSVPDLCGLCAVRITKAELRAHIEDGRVVCMPCWGKLPDRGPGKRRAAPAPRAKKHKGKTSSQGTPAAEGNESSSAEAASAPSGEPSAAGTPLESTKTGDAP